MEYDGILSRRVDNQVRNAINQDTAHTSQVLVVSESLQTKVVEASPHQWKFWVILQ